jgi:hypothetical protein
MVIAALQGNLGAEQNSAYDLLKHLWMQKRAVHPNRPFLISREAEGYCQRLLPVTELFT